MLADEPTASLDKQSGQEAVHLLRDLARQRGCPILLVTHDSRILDVADRIVHFEDGQIVESATTVEA
jgi:putative ABC transport system ATP-binding protein